MPINDLRRVGSLRFVLRLNCAVLLDIFILVNQFFMLRDVVYHCLLFFTSLYWSYSNGTLCCALYFIQICGNLIFLPYGMNHFMALKILVILHCEKLNVNLKVGF